MAARAASSAASTSNASTFSRFSRTSRDFSSLSSSSSAKPVSVRSSFDRLQVGEHPGEQLLVPVAADLVEGEVEERGPAPALRSRKMTGTVFMPRRRAASSRWWPPMTVLSSRRASTGWTKPHSRRLRVSASSSASEIRRGFAGSGRSSSIATCSTVIGAAAPMLGISSPVERREGHRIAAMAFATHTRLPAAFAARSVYVFRLSARRHPLFRRTALNARQGGRSSSIEK